MNSRLIDEHQAAERLGMSVETMRSWRKRGEGPNYVKIGRSVRYDSCVIERFISDNTYVPSVRAALEVTRVSL